MIANGRNRELSQEAFDLLLSFLDTDREQAGRCYEELRIKLVKIFTCRGCMTPEDLADETFNRVSKKVSEIINSYVGDPRLYFYGVARNVFLESVRKRPHVPPMPEPTSTEQKEAEQECLDQCMQKLTPTNRRLILEYYSGDRREKIERRKALAERLGIAPNALRIRAHRIRGSLAKCVFECLEHNAIDVK
jgi:RNA polymerase sigma factor (sigma-70 family)